LIEALHLTKRYGPSRGIEDVSFSIGRGEIVGLLGPNGAGKSTTIRILTGYLPPTSGFARVAGFDTLTQSLGARRQIGYLPENVPIYPELRVEEYLRYRAALKEVSRSERPRRIEVAIERCQLGEVRRRIGGHLSKGFRQRLGLAGALVADPPVLILDEPTIGLDPNQVIEMRSLVRDLAANRTILLSTHILPEVEAICSRVIVLSQGRLVADDAMDSLLRGGNDRSRVRVVVRGANGELARRLGALAGVESVVPEPEPEPQALRLRIDVAPGVDARAAIHREIVASGGTPLEITTVRASLEEVFGSLTRQEALAPVARP
jgi:gliding motility-associated transport system ATP-binding protein